MKGIPVFETIVESKIFTAFLLIVVLLVGFYLRFDNLDHWLNNKSQYLTSAGLPVTLGVDPYYYVDIADDLLHGKIDNFDEQRHFPVGTRKPTTLPLLSVLLALSTFLANQPLEWVAVLLPPFLGVLLAFPVYLLTYILLINASVPWDKKKSVSIVEAKLAGFSAALVALMSPPFVVRSSIGSCDTDILNVAFTTLCIYLAVCFYSAENNKKRLQCIALWGVTTLAFLWWWDQVVLPPLIMATGPMLLAFFFKRMELKKKTLPYLYVISTFLFVLIVWKSASLATISDQFFSLFSYIFGIESNSLFPAQEQLVQEQGNLTFMVLARNVAGNIYLYAMSLLGLLILPFIARKKILFLFPLLLLNIMAFSAMRFAVFLAPLLGLGAAGIVLVILLALRKLQYIRFAVVVPLLCLFCWPPFTYSQLYSAAQPLLAPVVYDGMSEIAAKTPKNSVIWSSWGHGHPLVYYAKRKTIGDGMYHPPFLDYVIKYPFATNNFRLAANWMQFYVVNGEKGLERTFESLTGDKKDWADGVNRLRDLLAAGIEKSRHILLNNYKMPSGETEKFLSFLYPADSPPIYVFMDYKLVAENWYEMGKWDLKKKTGPPGHTIIPVLEFQQGISFLNGVTEKGTFQVNLHTGACFMTTGESCNLKGVHVKRENESFVRSYSGRGIRNILYLTQEDPNKGPLGLIADQHSSNTVMIKLFFERKFDQDFFKPVIARLPFYLVCEVQGDKYFPENN
ncbi:MAG: hypothetical protein OEM01_12710 [Desulfobulbaceae bacterium]|nr:hypothetical protein [Desulfobulbaceae bacterium]